MKNNNIIVITGRQRLKGRIIGSRLANTEEVNPAAATGL
jgi:hypothetical protein